MQTSAVVELNGTSRHRLVPGDIIGRMPRAALRVMHPAISEAHALVSQRGTSLRLLALRGRFTVAGKVLADVPLRQGLCLELTSDIALRVLDVTLPPVVLAIDVPGVGRIVPPPVASILPGASDLIPGYSPDALAVLWIDDESLHVLRPPGQESTHGPGDSVVIGDFSYAISAVPLAAGAAAVTASDVRSTEPLTVALRYDSVHVSRHGATTVLSGIPARVLTEIGLIGVPVEWTTIAATIWPDEADPGRLRTKWDAVLFRIRRTLREFGLRRELLRTDGGGKVELVLAPHDRLLDET